jgi:hypothetical protein
MFSPDMVLLYKRLAMLGMLCASLAFFASPTLTETAFAAGCIEECMNAEAQCYDNCVDECTTNETNCGSCVETCATQFNSCTFGKVMCSGSGGGMTYNPNCEVDYTPHCPIIDGTADCNDERAHYGYTLRCNSIGGTHCMACPDHNWSCTGSEGSQSCY